MNESDRRINGRIVGAITRAAERPEHYNEGPELIPGEAGVLGLYQQGVTGMLSGNFGYLGQGRVSACLPVSLFPNWSMCIETHQKQRCPVLSCVLFLRKACILSAVFAQVCYFGG